MSSEYTPLPYDAATLHGALIDLTRNGEAEFKATLPPYVADPDRALYRPELMPETTVERRGVGVYAIKDQYPPLKGYDKDPVVLEYRCAFYGKSIIKVAEEGRAWRDVRYGSPAMIALLGRFIYENARLNPPSKKDRIRKFIGNQIEAFGKSIPNPYI